MTAEDYSKDRLTEEHSFPALPSVEIFEVLHVLADDRINMRDRFPGYYTPSNEDFKKLWERCLFLPDANILLHLFRYGANTTAQVLDTLQRLTPRVWIPYRARAATSFQ